MVAFGVGEVTAATFAEACDIVISETGDLPHIPQFSTRGPWSDPVGRTTSLLDGLYVDVRSRGWVVTARGSRAGTRARDLLRRDVDMCEELWPSRIGTVKVQCLGPWSMATAMEMSNGHLVLSDAGAVRDVAEALTAGVIAHARDVQRRFSADTVVVQVDEPYLNDVRRGGIEGTSDFDTLPPVHIDELQKILFPLYEVCESQGFTPIINERGYAPVWDLVPDGGALIDVATITSSRDLDAAGMALESRFSGDNRCAVSTDRVNLERVCSELGQDRGIFDVYAIGGATEYAEAYGLDRYIH
ncbi:hypothetical protein HMPREF1219_00365 [Corynebacterium pyruviciproducens ATCC BAA-1742]|uniref:Uncharacterized protein n=1 Tax=Corynebacterium pyruviciproducens ATCC BAA-1742 TaxID=1125779 RepID=S2ZL21_9CORY|nr:hypothetical protein [Corynebacterium pyruviciproducens]EPD70682.1 hypothetical protein HMPREF1219_00365 [Corynebacterium pyruviciproducens ATCC BAA-1742]